MVRLSTYLARAGVAARRKCDALIRAGRVTVNGEVVDSLGVKIDPEKERVEVDGIAVKEPDRPVYILLHKPRGVISAASDNRGRRTVIDIVRHRSRLHPVGRLDIDTTGVLLLTNDGRTTNRLIHPRYRVAREYRVSVRGEFESKDSARLERGVTLDDGKIASGKVLKVTGDNGLSHIYIALGEGRKREVKRMFEAVGHRVVALHRTRFAGIDCRGLAPGDWRYLKRAELGKIGVEPAA